MNPCSKDGLVTNSVSHPATPRLSQITSPKPISPDDESLFELLGERRVEQMVELFYHYNLKDEVTREFFQGVNIERLQRMQTRFLIHILGGHPMNTGKMRSAHRRLLDLGDIHFDAFLANLQRACYALNFTPKIIHRILTAAEATRTDVLGQSPFLRLKSSRQFSKVHDPTLSR